MFTTGGLAKYIRVLAEDTLPAGWGWLNIFVASIRICTLLDSLDFDRLADGHIDIPGRRAIKPVESEAASHSGKGILKIMLSLIRNCGEGAEAGLDYPWL